MNAQRDWTADLPPRALRLARRAQQWIEHGELKEAERSANEALAIAPAHPELLRIAAAALHAQARHVEAAALLREALAAWPDDATILNNLGCVLADGGDGENAVAAFRDAAKHAPESAEIRWNLAHALVSTADSAAAADAFREVLRRDPARIDARILRAESLTRAGRIDEAIDEFRTTIGQRPDAVRAWTGLVNLKTFRPSDEDLAALTTLAARTDLTADDRIAMAFAHGVALEAAERYSDAHAAIRRACAAKRATLIWNAATASRIVDTIAAAFAKPVAHASDADLGHEVIFIVGMPRSGTTLTEQILAAHPTIEGAGEIGDLVHVLRDESARRGADFPSWVDTCSVDDWARLGRDYLARTAHWRKKRPRFTDKSTLNWQLLGAARAMLPGARFVYAQRDPLETCWSCLKHDFAISQPFAYEIGELASYWHDHDRLMRQWRSLFGERIHAQVHEDFLRNPEGSIRALLQHCGLDYDSRCLRFHEAERNVHTASAAQVRSPLRRDTARAARYGALLDPLRAALAR